MKITIDTTQKVITLDQEVKLKDLYDFLQDLLKDNWQEYKLEVKTIYKSVPSTTDRIYPFGVGNFPPYDPPTTPYQPWKGTEIWYTMQTNTNG